MKFPKISAEPFQYPGTKTIVEYVSPEVTAVCPHTGLPDYYTVKILFLPDKKLPELKSLKLYFNAYRNYGIWHEHLANRIIEDFVKAVQPAWAYIELIANARGGIYTTVRRLWTRKGDDEKKVLEFMRRAPDARGEGILLR